MSVSAAPCHVRVHLVGDFSHTRHIIGVRGHHFVGFCLASPSLVPYKLARVPASRISCGRVRRSVEIRITTV